MLKKTDLNNKDVLPEKVLKKKTQKECKIKTKKREKKVIQRTEVSPLMLSCGNMRGKRKALSCLLGQIRLDRKTLFILTISNS